MAARQAEKRKLIQVWHIASTQLAYVCQERKRRIDEQSIMPFFCVAFWPAVCSQTGARTQLSFLKASTHFVPCFQCRSTRLPAQEQSYAFTDGLTLVR